MKNFMIIATSLLFVASCGNRTQPTAPVVTVKPSVFNLALKDSLGLIRGTDLGEEFAVVEQMEYDSALVVKSKFNLVYDYNLGNDNAINVKYIFAGTSVRLIELNITMNSELQADSVANDFKKYYTGRYGEPLQQMGVYVWKAPTAMADSEAFIELKDESAEYGFGKVNITIFPRLKASPAA